MEGTNKAHENGEAMGFVGVRLTVMLGHWYWFCMLNFMCETTRIGLFWVSRDQRMRMFGI